MRTLQTISTFVAALGLAMAMPASAQYPVVPDAVSDPHSVDLPAGSNAEVELQKHLARIAEYDDGPDGINAIIALNPDSGKLATAGEWLGLPLRGRAILVKDNIETREFPTTAGSLALADNMTGRDAPLVVRIRDRGGAILGKTNLSEWANIRDNGSTSGWSAIGGLTRNPHALDHNACGSSSGSAAAVAAGFAWAAIGTETDGSITCPASVNGVVGFKPSVGMVSRTHIVPISASQDTAGPMARSVGDAALLFQIMRGRDQSDPATLLAPLPMRSSRRSLDETSLEGVRIGVLRNQIGPRDDVRAVFEQALRDMEQAGAVLVDIEFEPNGEMYRDEYATLLFELREGMGEYLRSLPGEGLPRSLADLIAFNEANADTEMRWFGQSIFQAAEATTDRPAYEAARANALHLAGERGIDRLLAEYDVEVLVAPTTGPAWTSDLVHGDNYTGGIGAGSFAAIAGYPHLTVPMGAIERLPVGISFMAEKWSDLRVLQLGAAYERARSVDAPVPSFERWKPSPDALSVAE